MTETVKCPKCGSTDLMFSKKKQLYICEDCRNEFVVEHKRSSRRIYLSYGIDEHSVLAMQIKCDLEGRGHEVWYDPDCAREGEDREKFVEAGLDWVSETPGEGRFIVVLTPTAVRRPDGFCLDEIARAVQRKLHIVPVMAVFCEPPLSICRIQWLDMMDCHRTGEKEEKYLGKLDALVGAIEEDKSDFKGAQSRLLRVLEPLPFDADLQRHLARFTGRQWIFKRVDSWLEDPKASRIFWIVGPPGVGKTAIAAWLATNRRQIAAFHLCRHGDVLKSDPRRAILSIAYQLSTQLPDYQSRLNSLDLDKITKEPNTRALFDALITQPLSSNLPDPDGVVVILIDALDEASRDGRNELADLIASEFSKSPAWLRLIITSRPEAEVMQPLQGLTPYMLDTASPENDQDIREYLARELKPFTPEPEVSSNILDRVAAMSEGIFLYVELIRQELAQKRLSLDRLNEFPHGLGGVYDQFFRRQYPAMERYRSRISPVLETVTAALEPLAVKLIAAIFRWDEYDQAEFYQDLGAMFPITDGRVQPFHRSIVDWLTDTGRAGSYHIEARNGHVRLADYGWHEYARGVATMPDYMLAHLPAHLIWLERWGDSKTILADLAFFEVAWQLNEFDVKKYWSEIEERSGARITEAYRPFVEEPARYDGHSYGVAGLLYDTGHYVEALVLYNYLIQHFTAQGNLDRLKESFIRKGLIINHRSEPSEALKAFKEMERICRETGDRFGLQNCLGHQMNVFYQIGDLDGVIRISQEMDRIQDNYSKKEIANSLHVKGVILLKAGRLDEAMRLFKEKERICREIKAVDSLMSALNNQGVIYYDQGNYREVLRINEELERMCRDMGDRFTLQFALINQADIYYEWGDNDKTIALLKEAEQIERNLEHKNGIHRCLGNLAITLHNIGEVDEALRTHLEERTICEEINDKFGLQVCLGNLGLILYDRGRLQEAMLLLKEKEKLSLGSYSSAVEMSLGDQALIMYDWGKLDEALELHQKEEAMCREMGMKKDLQTCLCNQAEILRARGELDRALALYTEAERVYRELGSRIPLHNCLNGQALIWYDKGEREKAMGCLREAEEISHKIEYKKGLEASLGNEAIILCDLGDFEGAWKSLKEAEAIARAIDHKEGLAISLINQAIVLACHRHQPNAGLAVAREARDIAESCCIKILSERLRPILDRIELAISTPAPAIYMLDGAVASSDKSESIPKMIPWVLKIQKFERK